MALFLILAGFTMLSAVAALVTDAQTSRRLKSGEGAYADLLDYTGIFERDKVSQLPGVFERPDGRLGFEASSIGLLPKTRMRSVLGNPIINVLCATISILAIPVALLQGSYWWAPQIMAAAFQGAAWMWAILSVMRRADLYGPD